MTSSLPGWCRVAYVVPLFACALGAALFWWQVAPPRLTADGRLPNGANAPGDLTLVYESLGVAFGIAAMALQPWTNPPQRRWMGLASVCFGAWSLGQVVALLHAPPVAVPVAVLLLTLALWLSCAVLIAPTRADHEQERSACN